MSDYILPLAATHAGLETIGGKGISLARLAGAGLPVPGGFHVTTAAYKQFVSENRLQVAITAALKGVEPARPATLKETARTIAGLFARAAMPREIADAITQAYADLPGSQPVVAVRSSATAEDLPDLSFAGQQDTYLNIQGSAAVQAAVKRCWASLWTARAIGYRMQHGIDQQAISLAVVVQLLAPAEAAGVLFTANPIDGRRDQAMITAAWGLGEAIVGGLVTPDTLIVEQATGRVLTRETADKHVMTARAANGTAEQPVPDALRRAPVLSDQAAAEIARLGTRIEQLYGMPMDIEWALAEGQFAIVQARPITNLRAPIAPFEEWNDSLCGDYLWTNANVGEAAPDVMTPCAWSLIQIFIADTMAVSSLEGHSMIGNIGGRFYMNLSVLATMAMAFGMPRERFTEGIEQAFGRLPDGLQIPRFPVSRWRVLRKLIPTVVRLRLRVAANQKRLPAFLATAPARCDALHARIAATSSVRDLIDLWHAELLPFFRESSNMLEAGARRDGNTIVWTRRALNKLVGEADTNALLSGLSTSTSQLASLGLLLGLEQLARGEIDRATFARQHGHRGPHEFEVSIARPAEDTDWIDRQLAGMRAAPADARTLLARRQEAQAAAWERFRQRYPRKVEAMRRRIDGAAEAFRYREAARSEVIRAFWVLRAFVLHAGALTGQGDAIFFLSINEILALLGGDDAALARIPARRAAYARYSALPPYPALICGRFDPFTWAAGPHRRSDLFDAHGASVPARDAITGFPGAAGIVEGRARVILSPEEGDQLQAGEILVTTVTNVGWTPLFPRAAAVVTDVGAPLSHAAIIARELGIPAVVGCGNATMRLRTGDRVRVNGGEGTVEVLRE